MGSIEEVKKLLEKTQDLDDYITVVFRKRDNTLASGFNCRSK
jgi:hypothetical protein